MRGWGIAEKAKSSCSTMKSFPAQFHISNFSRLDIPSFHRRDFKAGAQSQIYYTIIIFNLAQFLFFFFGISHPPKTPHLGFKFLRANFRVLSHSCINFKFSRRSLI